MRSWHRWQDWVNLVVGVWLFLSPWLLNVSGIGSVAWSGWILGVLVVVMALWALASPESTAPEWFNVILGVLAFVVPWALYFSTLTNPTWSFVISGLIVIGLSAWALRELASGRAQMA